MLKQLKYYQNSNGNAPFITWLESLKDRVTRARIQSRLLRLVTSNYGDYKFVGEGVYELRIHFGAGYRIYFSEIDDKVILLISGGDKNHQAQDIRKAQEYWHDFKRRTYA